MTDCQQWEKEKEFKHDHLSFGPVEVLWRLSHLFHNLLSFSLRLPLGMYLVLNTVAH